MEETFSSFITYTFFFNLKLYFGYLKTLNSKKLSVCNAKFWLSVWIKKHDFLLLFQFNYKKNIFWILNLKIYFYVSIVLVQCIFRWSFFKFLPSNWFHDPLIYLGAGPFIVISQFLNLTLYNNFIYIIHLNIQVKSSCH